MPKLTNYYTRNACAGDDVIDLGMGNPTDPPQDLVVEKLTEAARDPKNHGYSEAKGIMSLRREVASKYLKQHGVRLDPQNQVLVCLGSKEGFSHMCLALVGPGDTAIVPAPHYPAHLYAVAMAAANAILLEVTDPAKFLSNIDYTCRHMVPRPKLLILNFPHNPTTTVVELEFYAEVAKLAKRWKFMVISDLAYADVAFDGYKTPSFLAAPGAIDVGVEFTTMSKGYNMAGWRVGFAAGNDEMLRAFHDQRLLRLRHVPAYPDCGHHGLAPHGCRGGIAGGDISAAPRRAVRRPGAAGLAGRASQGHDVRVDENTRALGHANHVLRIRHETA